MAQERYIATVQVLLPGGINSEAEACDFISEGLRGMFDDWQYPKFGGQRLSPQKTIVPDPYEEGDGFA